MVGSLYFDLTILREATYNYVAYVAALYRAAMFDGCWEGMGRGEKKRHLPE